MKKITKAVIVLLMIIFTNIVSCVSICFKSLIIKPVTFENVMYNWILEEIMIGTIVSVALIFAFSVLERVINESNHFLKLTAICIFVNMVVNVSPYIIGDMKIILDLGFMNTPEMWILDTVLLILSVYKFFALKGCRD